MLKQAGIQLKINYMKTIHRINISSVIIALICLVTNSGCSGILGVIFSPSLIPLDKAVPIEGGETHLAGKMTVKKYCQFQIKFDVSEKKQITHHIKSTKFRDLFPAYVSFTIKEDGKDKGSLLNIIRYKPILFGKGTNHDAYEVGNVSLSEGEYDYELIIDDSELTLSAT